MVVVESEINQKTMNKGLKLEAELTNKYTKEWEKQSTHYTNQWDSFIREGFFTGTQEQFEKYQSDVGTQNDLNRLLSGQIEENYQKDYSDQMATFQKKELDAADTWIEKTTGEHRRTRAWTLLPYTFASSLALGFGISKGLGAIASVSKVGGTAASMTVAAGFAVPLALSVPEIITSAKADPLSTFLETAPVVAGFGLGASVGVGGTLTPKYRVLEIPKIYETKFGGNLIQFPKVEVSPTNVKLFGFETKGGKGIVLGSSVDGKFKFGAPSLVEPFKKIPKGAEPIPIGSVLETKTIQSSLLSPELEVTLTGQRAIPVAKSYIKQTTDLKSKFADPKKLKLATEYLPPKALDVVFKIARREGGVIFGSKSRTAQLAETYTIRGKKYELTKVPKDVDIMFETASDKRLKKITEETIKELKKIGEVKLLSGKTVDLTTVREVKGVPFAIELKVNGKYRKGVEYKGKETPLDEIVPEHVVGFEKAGKPIKIGKQEVTSLPEELRGTLQGVLRVKKTEGGMIDIGPSKERLKDIGSVTVTGRTLEISKPSVKLKKTIVEFEKLFPAELVKSQVKKVLEGGEKIILADYRVKPSKIKSVTPSYIGKGILDKGTISPTKSPIYKVSSVIIMPKLSLSSIKSPSSKVSISASIIKSPLSQVKSQISKVSTSESMIKSPSSKVSPSISSSASKSSSVSSSASKSSSVSSSASKSSTSRVSRRGRKGYVYPPRIPGAASLKPRRFKKSRPKKRVVTKQGYNVYGKPIKQKKYKKINKVPLTRARARDMGAYIADHSLSTNFKIKQATKNAKKPRTNIPAGYYSKVKGNFRDYRIVKGEKIPMKDKWIEKKGKPRLNTRGEKNKITMLRKLKEVRKRRRK